MISKYRRRPCSDYTVSVAEDGERIVTWHPVCQSIGACHCIPLDSSSCDGLRQLGSDRKANGKRTNQPIWGG